VGVIDVVIGDRGVEELTLGRELPPIRPKMPRGTLPPEPLPGLVDEVLSKVAEYFAGTRTELDLPVDLSGADLSEFQRHVLRTVRAEVPYGETVTYGEVAELAGRPGAARAVGTAMRRNPVQLLVPCHRVVAANGIGGYGGGPDGVALKRALLDLEARARPTG
jgi:methylated-DNA-[protein]-cysteine S-methyltransferase